MRKHSLVIMLGVIISVTGLRAETTAEWPQWRGPNRDGTSPTSPPLITTLPAEGIRPLWKTEALTGGGWGSPIVADGKAYIYIHDRSPIAPANLPQRKFPPISADKKGSMSTAEYDEYEKNRRAEEIELAKLHEYREMIYCFDVADGKTLWKNDKLSKFSQYVSGTLTHADGKLYILGSGRHVRCVDAATGADLWNLAIPGGQVDQHYASSIAVVDGAAIVFAGRLIGVDAKTGELLWDAGEKKARGEHSSAVAWRAGDRDLAVANVVGGDTICFEPRTGKELWRVKSEANSSTPVVHGDLLITYGSSRRSGLRCFRMTFEGAKAQWICQKMGDKGSSPVVLGDHVYVQGEKRLSCVDLKTGEETWSTTLDLASPQYTSLVAADGKVIYAYEGVLCFAAEPQEFRRLYETKFDKQGLMVTEKALRKQLKLDEVERKPNGLEESTLIYQREVSNQGPVACTSPAIVDGRLILRFRNALACYDLGAGKTSTRTTAATK